MERRTYYPTTDDDWRLHLTQHWTPGELDRRRRPIMMVPGYAMNAFVLSFHPRGRSMVEYLCDRGFEVWTANLRGQGESRLLGRQPSRDARQFGIEDLSQTDIPTALSEVQGHTQANASRVDVVGCSIGISYLYAYLATHSDDHSVGAVVAVGGPLQWRDVHPLMKALFGKPAIARLLPTSGMRQMAAMALPLARLARPITDLYMNIDRIDFSDIDKLLNTVDDPSTQLNVDVARWIQRTDIVVAGQNVTEGMGDVELPILCVLARSDFIVPERSVLSIQQAYSPQQADELIDTLRVGADKQTSDRWYAHADLFIGDDAESDVFVPMGDWLSAH